MIILGYSKHAIFFLGTPQTFRILNESGKRSKNPQDALLHCSNKISKKIEQISDFILENKKFSTRFANRGELRCIAS